MWYDTLLPKGPKALVLGNVLFRNAWNCTKSFMIYPLKIYVLYLFHFKSEEWTV